MAAAVRLNTLDGGFIWDDRAAIVWNRDARASSDGGSPVADIFRNDFWGQGMGEEFSHKSYRPITVLSFRASSELHGLWPPGFRVANVLLHATNAAIWSLLLTRKWDCDMLAATAASLLFAVHPITTESVASIVGRADLLAAFFAWLGLLVYPDTTTTAGARALPGLVVAARFLAAILCGLAAALSKENGVTVFGLYVLYEGVLCCSRTAQRLSRRIGHRALSCAPFWLASVREMLRHGCLVRVAAASAAGAGYVVVHAKLHGDHFMYPWTVLENDIHVAEGAKERVLSYAYTHFLYAFKMLVPLRQSYDYGYRCIDHVRELSDPRLLLPALTYAFFSGCLLFGIRRKRPEILWLTSLIILPWLPASQIFFPVGVVLGERLLYMPVAAASTMAALSMECLTGASAPSLAAALARLFQLFPCAATAAPPPAPPRRGRRRRRVNAVACVYAAVFGVFAALTLRYNHMWRTEEALFDNALQTCPRSVKVLSNVGYLNLNPQGAPRAVETLELALEVIPEEPSSLYNMGVAHRLLHNFNTSRAFLRRSLRNRARSCDVWRELLELESEEAEAEADPARRLAAARRALEAFEGSQGVDKCRGLPAILLLRAGVAMLLGQVDETVAYARRALELDLAAEDDSRGAGRISRGAAYNTMALAYKRAGRAEDAVRQYQEGIRADPGSVELRANLATAYLDVPDRADEGFEMLAALAAAAPERPELLANLGFAHERRGDLSAAATCYERAQAAYGENVHPQLRRNLASVRRKLGGDEP